MWSSAARVRVFVTGHSGRYLLTSGLAGSTSAPRLVWGYAAALSLRHPLAATARCRCPRGRRARADPRARTGGRLDIGGQGASAPHGRPYPAADRAVLAQRETDVALDVVDNANLECTGSPEP